MGIIEKMHRLTAAKTLLRASMGNAKNNKGWFQAIMS